MKEFSIKNIILPMVVVLLAVMVVSIMSVNSIQNIKTECEDHLDALQFCHDTLSAKEKSLSVALARLNLRETDVEKYDEIYEQKEEEAQNLSEELIEKTIELERKEDVPTFVYPYRSVPSAEAYSKAARMELMLERLKNAQTILNQEVVHTEDVRLVLGYLYTTSLDLKNLFIENGVKMTLGEQAQKLYRENLDLISEYEGWYNNFGEFSPIKMETWLNQKIKIQINLVEGMQATYFLQ